MPKSSEKQGYKMYLRIAAIMLFQGYFYQFYFFHRPHASNLGYRWSILCGKAIIKLCFRTTKADLVKLLSGIELNAQEKKD
jgi:hypothetical protein